MPVYTVELDGRQYDIEGDRPPSEQEARAAIAQHTQPAASPRGNSPNEIGPLPWYRKPIPGLSEVVQGGAMTSGGTNTEDLVEYVPATAATVASMIATKNPNTAGIAGGLAGEAARQLFRRAVGAPQATGVIQQAAGLDPNSPEAAAASFGGEALSGLTGAAFSKLFAALSGATNNSARRSILNVLQAHGNEGKVLDPFQQLRLAQVAIDEGLVPAGSSRAGQLEQLVGPEYLAWLQAGKPPGPKPPVGGRLQEAIDEMTRLEGAGVAAGRGVEGAPVLERALSEIPDAPGGFVPRTGQPQRQAAIDVAEDTADLMAMSGGKTNVPLETAIAERRRLDGLLENMYEAGREVAPESKAAIQANADAWRRAIAESYPELGAANLKYSDLKTITKMMEESYGHTLRGGPFQSASTEAGAAGALAAGRSSIAAMTGARGLTTNARVATLSAAGKRLAAKLFEGGAKTAQLWVHAAAQWGLDKSTDDRVREAERNRRAQQVLREQGEGVVTP